MTISTQQEALMATGEQALLADCGCQAAHGQHGMTDRTEHGKTKAYVSQAWKITPGL